MDNKTPPTITNSAIQKAGKVLQKSKDGEPDYLQAIKTVNLWRLKHAIPMYIYKRALRKRVRFYKSPIVAQRLKRMPTIIDKLSRHDGMNLARMHDIGGVRGIVDSVKEVRDLRDYFLNESDLKSTIVSNQCKDYLDNPKTDGYRGIHLVFKFDGSSTPKVKEASKYNGMLIEMQLRTKLQHVWATAVETIGIFREESLKSGKGSKDWLKFFALVSASFAKLEETTSVPGYEKLSVNETFLALSNFEKKHGFLDLLDNMSFAADVIHNRDVKGVYHVITLNPKEKSVTIMSFGRNDLEKASQYYAQAEEKADKREKLETVLVSVGRLNNLRKAYPNYFLDIKDFVKKIKILTDEISN